METFPSLPKQIIPGNDQNRQQSTYVNILNRQPVTSFPKKDQAIIIPAVDNLKIQDYVKAVGTIVQPKNVLFSSRISNNRMCIYLASKETVDIFMKNNKNIKINDNILEPRRLITPAIRIVLSNVCPTIPHSTLESHLIREGLKLVSPMSFLKMGISEPEYSHVYSFRRQIYIASTAEDQQIPESLLINYDETTYRIFLSNDSMKCFICKHDNHLANNCPNNQQHNIPEGTSNSNDNIETKKTTSDLLTPIVQQNTSNYNETFPELQTIPQNDTFLTPPSPTLSTKKKRKISNSSEKITQTSESQIESVRPIFQQNLGIFPLNYDQFNDFLENAIGSTDPLSIARQYTNNINELINMIDSIYPHFSHKAMKSRCTRLKKKLLILQSAETDTHPMIASDTESEMSTSSQLSSY